MHAGTECPFRDPELGADATHSPVVAPDRVDQLMALLRGRRRARSQLRREIIEAEPAEAGGQR